VPGDEETWDGEGEFGELLEVEAVCRLALLDESDLVAIGDWCDDAQSLSSGKARGRKAQDGKRVYRTKYFDSGRVNCCNWHGLSPVLMPLTGLAPASPYFGLRAMGQLSFPQ